jgi:hypothetical protein
VLTALDLYWHPQLGCTVSLSARSVITTEDLPKYTWGRMAAYNVVSETALAHVTVYTRSLSELRAQCSSTVITHPIPGLPPATKAYQCTTCRLWYQSHGRHLQRSPRCKEKVSGKRWRIPLFPAQSSEKIDVEFKVPKHRLVGVASKNTTGSASDGEPNLVMADTTEEELTIRRWMDPQYKNPTGPNAPKLKPGASPGLFQFTESGGTVFSCSHQKTDNDFPSPLAFLGCAVLSYFQLYFSPTLNAIVYPRGRTLVDETALHALVKSRQHGLLNEEAVSHVKETFSLACGEHAFKETHKDLILHQPVVGLDDPLLSYRCSACRLTWDTRRTAQPKRHRCPPPSQPFSNGTQQSTVIETYSVRLWKHPSEARRVEMSPEWVEAHTRLHPRQPQSKVATISYSVDGVPHLQETGFSEHLKTWNTDDHHILLLLDFQSSDRPWPKVKFVEDVEQHLHRIRNLSKVYLRDAEHRLEAAPILRFVVTHLRTRSVHGRCFKGLLLMCPRETMSSEPGGKHAAGHFYPLSTDPLTMVANEIFRLIAVPLRYWAICLKKQDSDCKDLLDTFGAFTPILSPTQTSMVQALLKRITKKPLVEDLELLQFIHQFLLEIFSFSLPITRRMSSLVEQVVLLRCLSTEPGPWRWRSATWMYGVLCLYIRVGRTAVAQAACLGGKDVKYTRVETAASPSSEDGVEEAHSSQHDTSHEEQVRDPSEATEAGAVEALAVEQLEDQADDGPGGVMAIASAMTSSPQTNPSSMK